MSHSTPTAFPRRLTTANRQPPPYPPHQPLPNVSEPSPPPPRRRRRPTSHPPPLPRHTLANQHRRWPTSHAPPPHSRSHRQSPPLLTPQPPPPAVSQPPHPPATTASQPPATPHRQPAVLAASQQRIRLPATHCRFTAHRQPPSHSSPTAFPRRLKTVPTANHQPPPSPSHQPTPPFPNLPHDLMS